ncbi:hypothetical protein EC9_14080 [Rosistilla ulvae]|uniref:Polysaccharide biosynthesis protein C-terminal domain-containing protein n=1 Tax=Rosistilla ulvae TaxID=1930277 RepID=A0A517LX98_9BACT|nr:hypothetical protein [Rosistilla ulvae]QDS87230.1 hypothetical protein EC9_14080 [Rosistilla ulvae]
MLALLCRFGADEFLYSTITAQDTEFSRAISHSHATLLLSFGLLACAIIAWLGIRQPRDHDTILAVISTTVALILLQNRATAFQIRGRTFASSVTFPGAFLLVVVIAIAAGVDLKHAFFLAALISIIVTLPLVAKEGSNCEKREQISPRKLIAQMVPYAAINTNKVCFAWGASMYVVTILDAAALSTFVVASRLSAMFSLPANCLNAYVLRELTMNQSAGESVANYRLMTSVIRLSIAIQLLILLIYLCTFPIIAGAFRVDPIALLVVMTPLCVAQIFHGLSGPAGAFLLVHGQQHVVATISIVVAMFAFAFGYLGAANFGLIGLGIATGAMLVIQNIAFMVVMFRCHGNLPLSGFLGINSCASRSSIRVRL